VSAALGSGTRLRLQQGFQFRAFSGDEQFSGGRIHARPPELAVAPPSSPISALSLRIFRGRGSSTATLGTHDRFRVHRVRFQPRLCKNADIGVAKHDRSVRGSRSYADRFYQSADAQNAHYSFHVVGQDVQGHFGADVLERSHLEVSGSHPGLYRTEGMLHGLAAVRATYPGFDRGALAQPRGWLRAPSLRSAVPCQSCTGPSARSFGKRRSTSAAVSCHPLRWCSDGLSMSKRLKLGRLRLQWSTRCPG
jgi:hypothetical protein